MKAGSIFISFCFFLSYSTANSQLRLPSIISSGMVLQQNDSVTLWGWAYPGEPVTIQPSWESQGYLVYADNGAKWKLKIKTPVAGGPFNIRFTGSATIVLSDVWSGEVWLCSGQSNMEWSYRHGLHYMKNDFDAPANAKLRLFHIPRTTADHPQEDLKAEWKVADSNTLKTFSAVAYYFGRKINEELNVPVGLIHASWGGTPAEPWTPAEQISNDPILSEAVNKLQTFPWWPSKPGLAYNAMIAPLTNFSIAGAIWYQGESNTTTYNTYDRLLTTMIDAWRNEWKKDFPFYYVQIAPYRYNQHNIGALLQEAQTRVMQNPGTGMVVVTDLVDSVTDIHPSNKYDVGYRLANWALARTYGKTNIIYKSPSFQKLVIVKNRIQVHFSDLPTGFAAVERPAGFFISGADQNWLPANASIKGNMVELWHPAIREPKYIRYGFGNTIIGNMKSREGLPLLPFRTDAFVVDISAIK